MTQRFQVLYLLSSVGLLGCAVGTSSKVDHRGRADGPVADLGAPDSPGPADTVGREAVPDRRRDLPRDLHASPDLSPDRRRDTALPPDLCPPCGAGMICSKGACVCDPKSCAGCCASNGSACKTGKDSTACGSGGATCAPCSGTSCKTASCSTGTCVLTVITDPPYPCPGSFGTLCGGSTGVICNTGLTCATFGASGSTGFCTEYCTTSGATCYDAPVGTAECDLTGSSGKHLCGFLCDIDSCPDALSCDYSDYLCKP